MFIIGKKISMTQIFQDDGTVVPVTIVAVEPMIVTGVKTKEIAGYDAVQYGYGTAKNAGKRLVGAAKGLSFTPRNYKEQRGTSSANRGDLITLDEVKVGDMVKVVATSKAKGFQGAMKRHGFHGLPSSHGHKAVKRHVGSIGQRFPQHTLKGMRMAGRMGGERTTVRGLKIMAVDSATSRIAIKGALPGRNGSQVVITTL